MKTNEKLINDIQIFINDIDGVYDSYESLKEKFSYVKVDKLDKELDRTGTSWTNLKSSIQILIDNCKKGE